MGVLYQTAFALLFESMNTQRFVLAETVAALPAEVLTLTPTAIWLFTMKRRTPFGTWITGVPVAVPWREMMPCAASFSVKTTVGEAPAIPVFRVIPQTEEPPTGVETTLLPRDFCLIQ